ncbi:hypothetical protein [Helicobacter canis]|uniref:hypothetical protein n=1 Tax=Helicobacter canis TaxID=29419 RepID=UPI0004233E86|nr:hypothetical protein [Helicobacter canis]
MWDSACSDKSAIASSPLRLRTPSARPCVDSQSPDFSSTILESYATCLKPPESSCFLSLRGEAEAIHKNNADSSGLLHCVRNDGKKWILARI